MRDFEEPQVITDIQRQYVEAGCDVITANTFGANAHKLDGAATYTQLSSCCTLKRFCCMVKTFYTESYCILPYQDVRLTVEERSN